MATHRDVVQRAAFQVGLRRAGQDLEGAVYVELLNALTDYLLELDEEQSLDFDPTEASSIPDERMAQLVPLFMYTPVFDQFDLRRNPSDREALAARSLRRFYAAVVGDSDFIEAEARDY